MFSFSYTLFQSATFRVCKLPSSKGLNEKTNSRNLMFTLILTLLYVLGFFTENDFLRKYDLTKLQEKLSRKNKFWKRA